MAERDLKLVIRAADEFSATLKRYSDSLEGIERETRTRVSRASQEFDKLTSASEYAAAGLQRVRSTAETLVFGAIIGAVSAFTEALIDNYRESENTTKRYGELNSAIMDQAKAWKLLPEPMAAVSRATLDLYNSKLKLSQLLGRSEERNLKSELEDLESMRRTAEINQKAFPGRTEFARQIGEFDVQIAEAKLKLIELQDLLNMEPAKNVTLETAATKALDRWQKGYTAAFDDFYAKMKHKRRGDMEPEDPFQVWLNVPDYDALEADIKTREQNMVNGIIAAREEYQAQFAAAAITISGLLTEEQIAAIEMQKETRFEMESNYEDMLLDRHLAYSEQAMQIERNLQQTKMNLQFTAANHAIALMTLLGGKNKEFALIALAAQKGLAMAQVFISGEAAAAAALVPPPVGLGPIAGAPLATSIRAASYQSMALIAATGLVEAAMGAGGGPSGVGGGGGVGALPIAPPALSSDSSQGGETRIEINIINPMGNEDWDALAEEAVIPAFNRAVDRAVVVKATTIGG